MKKTLFILFSMTILFACKQDPEIPISSINIADSICSNFYGIELSCVISANTSITQVSIEYSISEDFENVKNVSLEKKGSVFSANIDSLSIQTKYYYRYIVSNIVGSYCEDTIRCFSTKEFLFPQVITLSADSISGTKARLLGQYMTDFGKPITEYGFLFGNDSVNVDTILVATSLFSTHLQGLRFGTKYYYCAYAKSDVGTGRGEWKSFQTTDSIVFGNISIYEIRANSISVKSNLPQVQSLCEGYQYWSNNDTITINNSLYTDLVLNNLQPDTKYNIRAFLETIDGMFYSNTYTFTTANGVVLFEIELPSNITSNSAFVKAKVITDGGSLINKSGFCYSLQSMPTLEDCHIEVTPIDKMFSATLSLNQNTNYYVRAYAINAIDTSYSDEISFKTTYNNVTFGTTSINEIKATSIHVESTILSNGGCDITECGYCYALSPHPTILETKQLVTDSKDKLNATINGLTPLRQYYIRPYAINNNGTFYGEEKSVATTSGTIIFDTPSASNLSPSSALIKCSIEADGGSTIIERGFCYSMSKEPSVQDKKITIVGTLGEMSAPINNLQNDTKYYVRAFAINEMGIFYSNIIDFSTLTGFAVLTETNFSNVLARKMTLTSSVSSDGGNSISERGFCYSTIDIPTINTNKICVSGTIGKMQTDIEDLTPSTTYHFRSYAINDYGTFYGPSSQIVMPSGDPIFGNMIVNNIKTTSAEIYYSVISDGGTPILSSGICYGTSSLPTIDDFCVKSTNNIGDNVAYLTQLERGKKYTVRIYITSSYGTIYSEPVCFDTPDSPIQFTNIQFSNICVHSFKMNCSMIYEAGSVITECGFAYTTEQYPDEDIHKLILSQKSLQLDTTAHLLRKNTTYKVYAYAIIDNIEFRSATWTAKTLAPPEGAAPEIYTLSNREKVYIAQGNLQYNAVSSDWRFAEDQTEVLGKDASPWVDRFRYGSNSEGEIKSWNDNYDWGMVNPISNGGNIKGLWHTPTGSQWVGLLNNHKRALATIAGISGLIFFPDNWVTPIEKNIKMGGVEMNTLTLQDWKILEEYGAIFLRYNEVDLLYYYKDNTIHHQVQISDVICILEPYWTADSIVDWVEPVGKYSGYYVQGHFIEKDDTGFKSGYFSQGNYFPVRLFQDLK